MAQRAKPEAASEGEKAPDAPAAESVKVRCRACRALNDEAARVCDKCGAEL